MSHFNRALIGTAGMALAVLLPMQAWAVGEVPEAGTAEGSRDTGPAVVAHMGGSPGWQSGMMGGHATDAAPAHGHRGAASTTGCPIVDGWPQTGSGGMAAPGMMGGMPMGRGMMGQGMMGPGMMGGPMTAPGATGEGMMGQGMMGQGMMNRGGSMLFDPGDRVLPDLDLTVEDVQHFLRHRLEMHGNERLKLGTVEPSGADAILAEITTVDGSLVLRLEVDKHSGAMRSIE